MSIKSFKVGEEVEILFDYVTFYCLDNKEREYFSTIVEVVGNMYRVENLPYLFYPFDLKSLKR